MWFDNSDCGLTQFLRANHRTHTYNHHTHQQGTCKVFKLLEHDFVEVEKAKDGFYSLTVPQVAHVFKTYRVSALSH